MREFKKPATKVNIDALFQYEGLKEIHLPQKKRNNVSDDTITVFLHNVRSL